MTLAHILDICNVIFTWQKLLPKKSGNSFEPVSTNLPENIGISLSVLKSLMKTKYKIIALTKAALRLCARHWSPLLVLAPSLNTTLPNEMGHSAQERALLLLRYSTQQWQALYSTCLGSQFWTLGTSAGHSIFSTPLPHFETTSHTVLEEFYC